MAGEANTDPRKQAEFDRLMNLAHINRRRGEYKLAEELVTHALDVLPGNPEAREFAADLLYATGKWQEAGEAYKSIYQDDPSRTAAEEKYARVLLQIAEGKRQQDLLKDLIENPQSQHRLPDRSPAVAAVLSGIAGLGHVYCGEAVKGAVIMAVTFISWLLFLLMVPHRVQNESLSAFVSRFTREMDVLTVLFLLIALSVHAYAIVNAAVTADKMNSRKKGIL